MNRIVMYMVIGLAATTQVSAQNIDMSILRRCNVANPHDNIYWMQTSHSAYWMAPSYTVGNLVTGIIQNDKQAMKNGFSTALSVGIGLVVSGGVKNIIDRPRPTTAYPDQITSYSMSAGKSFPSGHTTLAFATATSMSLQCKKWYITIPAFAWAASVGYSRMALGRHYPSDVAAGALVGIGSGYLSHWVTKKIFK